MRLLVVGAASRLGRLVVSKALGHGHEVTALVYRASSGAVDPRLRVIEGDVRQAQMMQEVVRGKDSVAFALSPRFGGAGIHETGIANVIWAMAEGGVSRLAAVSAAGAFDRSDRALSIGYRLRLATTMRSTLDDLEAMERRIMASDLGWTIVRPFGMSDEPATGHYRVSLDGSLLRDPKRIPREDVASILVKALETDAYVRRAVVVAT